MFDKKVVAFLGICFASIVITLYAVKASVSKTISTESGDSITISYEGGRGIYTLDSGLLITDGDKVAASITGMTTDRFNTSVENIKLDAEHLSLIDEGVADNIVYAVFTDEDSTYGITWINGSATGLWFTGYSDAQSLVNIIKDCKVAVESTTSQARSIDSVGLSEALSAVGAESQE